MNIQNKKNLFRVFRIALILFCNLLLLFLGIFLIEYFFGNWRHTKGAERLSVPQNVAIEKDISDIYPSETGKIFYRRDANGLRGPFTDVSEVKLLTLGGSTTDQSDISEGDTWQDVLAADFRKEGKEVQIANAGIDGQSVLGHSRSLRIWLRHIPGLKPGYVLAYIGINDLCTDEKMYAPFFEDENSLESLIARRSALYYLYQTFRGIVIIAKKRLRAGKFVYPRAPSEKDHALTSTPLFENYDGLFDRSLDAYEQRLRRLLRRIRTFKAIPIFVTQKKYYFRNKEGRIFGLAEPFDCWGQEINGVDAYHAFNFLNQRTLKVCREESLMCFDLAKELDLKYSDYSDREHTTPSGSAKIGHYFYKKMKHLF